MNNKRIIDEYDKMNKKERTINTTKLTMNTIKMDIKESTINTMNAINYDRKS